MRMRIGPALLLGAVLAVGTASWAVDVWDQSTDDDNSVGTDNGLTHGTDQIHDLAAEAGVADEDWFVIATNSRSSYEAIVDGTTGDTDIFGEDLARLDALGAVVQTSSGLSGNSVVLHWRNTSSDPEVNYIRVNGASCGTTCSSEDQYRIRFYETTYSLPRFNNTGSQLTILTVANMTSLGLCTADFHFYNASGTFLGTHTNVYSARQLMVLNTSTLPFAAGASGSIIVSHTCGYGGLAGKAIALEPSTGFTFETQLVPSIL